MVADVVEDEANEDLRLLAVPSGALCEESLKHGNIQGRRKLYLRVARPRLDSLFLCLILRLFILCSDSWLILAPSLRTLVRVF